MVMNKVWILATLIFSVYSETERYVVLLNSCSQLQQDQAAILSLTQKQPVSQFKVGLLCGFVVDTTPAIAKMLEVVKNVDVVEQDKPVFAY
jgi:hypothetical protein